MDLYRAKSQQRALEKLAEDLSEDNLWHAIVLFAGEPFKTARGLEYTYSIKGYEIFFSRREKSVTKSTVEIAFRKAVELNGVVKGPKKLGVFGASYIYPVFIKLGVIQSAK